MESLNILPKNWGKKGERTEDKGQRKKYSLKHRKEKKYFWIAMSETNLNKNSTELVLKPEFHLTFTQFCDNM